VRVKINYNYFSGFSIFKQKTSLIPNRPLNGKGPCLEIKISHNATLRYATNVKSASNDILFRDSNIKNMLENTVP
jgi:hypothetical protein